MGAFLRSSEAQNSGARLLHRIAQQVSFLLQRAASTKVPGIASREKASLLHSSRHVAIVVVTTPLATGDDTKPVVFARLLTGTTAMSYPPMIGSEAERQLNQEAQRSKGTVVDALMQSALLTKERELVLTSRQVPVVSGVATRLIDEWQRSAERRHAALSARGRKGQKARAVVMDQDPEERNAAQFLADHNGISLEAAKALLDDEQRNLTQLFAASKEALDSETTPEEAAKAAKAPTQTKAPADGFDRVLDTLSTLFQDPIFDIGCEELLKETPAALPLNGPSRVIQLQRMERNLREHHKESKEFLTQSLNTCWMSYAPLAMSGTLEEPSLYREISTPTQASLPWLSAGRVVRAISIERRVQKEFARPQDAKTNVW